MTSQKTAEFGSAASSVKPIDSHARFIVVGVIVVGSFIALLNQTVMSPAMARASNKLTFSLLIVNVPGRATSPNTEIL